jgi:hypothetical protein
MSGFAVLPRFDPGFRLAIAVLLQRPDARGVGILVSSNPFTLDCESALIAEYASHDRASGTYILRGTKLISRLAPGGDYEPVASTVQGVDQVLRGVPVSYVVIHTTSSPRSYRHHGLLKATMASYPQEWKRIYYARRTVIGEPHTIEIYRYYRNLQGQPIHFSVDLERKLGHSVEVNPQLK